MIRSRLGVSRTLVCYRGVASSLSRRWWARRSRNRVGADKGGFALGCACDVGVVFEGAPGGHPAPGDRSASVFAGVVGVLSCVGDELAYLAQGEDSGVEFVLGLWVHAAGAGASCSRGWASGAPVDVTATRCCRRLSVSAWKSTRSK